MRIRTLIMPIAFAITVFTGARLFLPAVFPEKLPAGVTNSNSISCQRFQSGIAYPCATMVCLDLPGPDKSPDETLFPGAPIETGVTLVNRTSFDLTILCKETFFR